MNRDHFIVKLLYKIFFDISNSFRDITEKAEHCAVYVKDDFTPSNQLIFSKFISLCELQVHKVSLKSDSNF